MKLPKINGVIERRILVNYRVDAGVLARTLPAPFRPKLHRGFGMVGICLIRLRDVRPGCVPAVFGVASENAAHRTAVEWDGPDGRARDGVFVRRRDTSSRLNSLAGGRVFPGIHSHAAFTVKETATHFEVALKSDDGKTTVAVVGDVAAGLPAGLPGGSIFQSLEEASEFFRSGSMGYSATPDARRFQGLELRCAKWQVEPLAVASVRSSFFEDREIFPAGSIEFDCALLMRDIEHEWHAHDDLCCSLAVI